MRPVLFAVLVAASLAAGDARAEPPYSLPVYVDVVGSGSIRVRIASAASQFSDGPAAPCDSFDNVQLWNGWVPAGHALFVRSPSPCICEEHTYGAFREDTFSTSRIVCQGGDAITGVPYPWLVTSVSTDE